MKKILTFFLTLLLIILPITSNAGFFKKGVKGYVASKVISKAVKKAAAKKIGVKTAKGLATKDKKLLTRAEKKEVKAHGPVENGELTVGNYGDMRLLRQEEIKEIKSGVLKKVDKDYELHHIPSSEILKRSGIDKRDGVAVKLLKERHAKTRTHGYKNTESVKSEKFRDAVARDVKDFKNLYKDVANSKDKAFQKEIRSKAQDIIKKNKELHPDKMKKEPKI